MDYLSDKLIYCPNCGRRIVPQKKKFSTTVLITLLSIGWTSYLIVIYASLPRPSILMMGRLWYAAVIGYTIIFAIGGILYYLNAEYCPICNVQIPKDYKRLSRFKQNK